MRMDRNEDRGQKELEKAVTPLSNTGWFSHSNWRGKWKFIDPLSAGEE